MRHFKQVILLGLLLTATTGNSLAQSVWTARNSGTLNHLYSAVWTGTQLVSVGGASTILTSPDGITWVIRKTGTDRQLWTITWTGTRFVTGGNDSVRTSSDGINWTARYGTPQLLAVASMGSQLVAAWPGGEMVTSPDGITWTGKQFGNSASPTYVTSIGGQLWAFGYNIVALKTSTTTALPSIIMTSADAISWASKGGSSAALTSLAKSGNLFVAVGSGGTILTSPDGATWTSRPSGTLNGLNAVAWTGNQFIAVGDSGTILASSNGISWTMKTSRTVKFLRAVAWTGNQIVAMGDNGTILTSPQDPVAIASYLHPQITNTPATLFTINGRNMTRFKAEAPMRKFVPLLNIAR